MNPPPLILRGRCASLGYAGLVLGSLRANESRFARSLWLVVYRKSASAFFLAASNSSPGFQRGIWGAFATLTPR